MGWGTPRWLAAALSLAMPAAGQPAAASGFIEVKSDHFVVQAALDEAEARELAVEAERIRAGMLKALFHGAQVPGRMPLIVLRDHREMAAWSDENVGGFATRGLVNERLFVIDAEGHAAGNGLLQHELAHPLLDVLVQRQPRWLAEGLGCLMETLRVDPDGAVRVGTPPKGRLSQLLSMGKRPLPVKELRAWKFSLGDENRALYASSWLLVHWLVFGRNAAFADLQQRLARAEEPDAALRAALPDLDDDKLDLALREWLDDRTSGNQWPLFTTRVELPPPQLTVRPLSQAEAHALRATVAALAPTAARPDERRARVKAQLDAALALEPTNVTALLALGRSFPRTSDLRDRLRAATAKTPRDWRAWWALGRTLARGGAHDAPERLRALQTAVRLSPFSAAAVLELSRAHLAAGNQAEALAFASGAARLEPAWRPALTNLAWALYRAGRCDEGRAMVRRALEAALRDAAEADVVKFRESLEALEQRCTARARERAAAASSAGAQAAADGAAPHPPSEGATGGDGDGSIAEDDDPDAAD